MFNYDWFHSGGLQRQIMEARRRCGYKKFPEARGSKAPGVEFEAYCNALHTRIVLYMKDGLTYEMKEIADIGTASAMAFECVPVDENYQVGSYVIVVPFEDIARVEVFAVHPDDKPQETLRIPGFRAGDANRD